jgi:putative chitinase
MITSDQLKAIMPYANHDRIELFVLPLNNAMRDFEINTRLRIAGFLSQVAQESGSLVYVKELASGKAYEGRVDLGNDKPGDGVKYAGKGLIQVTGKLNYTSCSKALAMDFVSKPELLELPEWAAKSAGWFWKTHGLNEISDTGDIKAITKRVNGGYTALNERTIFYQKALSVING